MSTLPPAWKFRSLGLMAAADAPRAFTGPELASWLAGHGIEPTRRTLTGALVEWEAAGAIRKVAHGIYLNLRATPEPTVEEAAQRVRPGAIVSLATVLGRAGVINNPVYWTTAVIPTGKYDRLESQGGQGVVFRFAQMRHDLLPRPGTPFARDALEPYAQAPTATPEKALLDWLYLATSPRGAARWPLPPAHDWDIGDLDDARLDRLARRMGLVDELAQFRDGLARPAPRVALRRGPR